MRTIPATLLALCVCALLSSVACSAARADSVVDDLPTNEWVKLPVDSAPSYNYSQPIYVPSRETVLHWGGVKRSDPWPGARNDVRAFDWKKRDWTSDYPRAKKLPGLIGPPHGKGTWYKGQAEMLEEFGTPTPSAIVNAICYDGKRDQVVVTLKGLMAAYDPQQRKWRDMQAKTVLYGKEIAGGPPVYGAGTCYDPHNDEIVMFPHWGGKNVDKRDTTGEVSAHLGTFVYSYDTNTWRRQKSDGRQPPPRCATPLVYHPEAEAIVMFGGHHGLVRTDLKRMGRNPTPGGLNDTWVYDVTTRRWHKISTDRRPPVTRLPNLNYDPDSGLLLSVTRSPRFTKEEDRRTRLWALEVKRTDDGFEGRWYKLHETAWSHPVSYDWFDVTLDVKRRVLLLTQTEGRYRDISHAAFAMRLDLSKLKHEPAPKWTPPRPIEPTVIPPDDPKWVKKLRSLPANKWIHVDVERDADTRDWGNAACDPVRGHVYYFGGGHSTYQVNDVAIYVVGANKWVYQAGEHNDWVPPVNWGGVAMGFRGGPHAHHQRNEYVALDGRLYEQIGCRSARRARRDGNLKDDPYAWYYDVDLGGVWRQKKIDEVRLGEDVPGTFGVPHMVDPVRMRVLGFGGALEPYDGRHTTDEAYFAIYDVKANRLSIKALPDKRPNPVYECRPFCHLPDRDQVFFFASRQDRPEWGKFGPPKTWLYDVKTNRFTDLAPKSQPPGDPRTVVYLPGQDAIFAILGKRGERQQWIYSLRDNRWRQLPLKADREIGFAGPYAQTVYVPKYGVLVNLGSASRGTAVMRPEVTSTED